MSHQERGQIYLNNKGPSSAMECYLNGYVVKGGGQKWSRAEAQMRRSSSAGKRVLGKSGSGTHRDHSAASHASEIRQIWYEIL